MNDPSEQRRRTSSEGPQGAGIGPSLRVIFLIGYRGSGKTSLGRLLAARLGYEFFDTDQVMEPHLGMPIADYFSTHGEPRFRQHEVAALEEAIGLGTNAGGGVVATGGGIVLNAGNVQLMRETGCVVWLSAPVETLRQRLTGDPNSGAQRPALSGTSAVDEIESVLRARLPLYRSAAHVELSTADQLPEALVDPLLERLHSVE